PARARGVPLPDRPRRARAQPEGERGGRRSSLRGPRRERGSMGAVVLGRVTEVPRSRLAGWSILVTALAALSYAANLADTGDTPDDLLYRWSSAIGGLVQSAILPAIVLLIARGIAPATLGLTRPAAWTSAVGRIAAALVAIWVIGAALNPFLPAGKEQGLVPDKWDPGHAAPFVANFI